MRHEFEKPCEIAVHFTLAVWKRMTVTENFEARLMELDPRDDEFVLSVDTLLESLPVECHESLIPAIFRFFEKYPLEDCGAPGTLVHLTEHFYPSYKSILLNSLARAPSYNAILMTNRILNSNLSAQERQEYLSALSDVAIQPSVNPVLAQQARHFIEHQAKKHS